MRDAVTESLSLAGGEMLLDIGCGRGGLLTHLLEISNIYAMGLERSPMRAAEARRSSGAAIFRGDAQALPFQPDTMDVVVLAKSLHHMAPEVRSRTLQESRRVLKVQGRLLVLEKAAPQNWLEKASLFLQVLVGGENRQVYSLFGSGLAGELGATGFDIVDDTRIDRIRLVMGRPRKL